MSGIAHLNYCYVGKKIVNRLPVPLFACVLVASQFLSNAAMFASYPLLAVHLHELSFGSTAIGSVLTANLLATRLSPLLFGPLADRIGARGIIIVGLVLRGLCFFAIAAATSITTVLSAAVGIGLAGAAYESGVYGALARADRAYKSKAFLLNNQALNLGVIVGPLVGLAAHGGSFAATSIVSGVLLLTIGVGMWFVHFPALGRSQKSGERQGGKPIRIDIAFVAFCAASVAWWFIFSQLYVLIPLRVAQVGSGIESSRLVYLTNGLVGLTVAVLTARLIGKLDAAIVLGASQTLLIPAFVIPFFLESLPSLLVVVGIYTVSETLTLTSIDIEIARLAPAGRESTYFGFANLPWVLGAGLGNFVGSAVALNESSSVGWTMMIIAAAMSAISTVAYHLRCSARAYRTQ